MENKQSFERNVIDDPDVPKAPAERLSGDKSTDFTVIADLISIHDKNFMEAYNAAVYDECIAIAHKLRLIKKITPEQEEFVVSYLSQF